MTEKPLVSVIINCYNGEKYLREAIDSVIAQTYENWELVFWDNQSTDSTREIVESYKNPKIKYFYAPEHTPLGEARNLAVEKSNGEYISFLDSDDVWLAEFLNEEVTFLINDKQAVGSYSNYYLWKNDNKTIYNSNKKQQSHSIREVLNDYEIGMSACVLRSCTIKENNIYFDKKYQLIEDLDFFLKLLEFGSFIYNPRPLCLYRVNLQSETHRLKSEWAGEYLSLYDKLCVRYKNGDFPTLQLEDFRPIKIREISYLMEACVENNDRLGLLKLICNNKYMPFRSWLSRLVYVFGGKKIYQKLQQLKDNL